jgi:3-phosphoshikimate 1-carboxyvinyltransferase
MVIHPAARFGGRLRVPGDKSVSHRYALLAALARGRSSIRNFSPGADCRATVACLAALGVDVHLSGKTLTTMGRRPERLCSPTHDLDARNSGTTARLLAGVLAGEGAAATIVGDASLMSRPMKRVATPLREMGARIELRDDRLPMVVRGGSLHGIDFAPAVPSAQVKSAVLLAGLQAEGVTRVNEAIPTRNHTELALRLFGVEVTTNGPVSLVGGQPLTAVEADVPGDFSSAAFWLVAAAGTDGGDVQVDELGLNPTRTALLEVLARAGADVEAQAPAGEGFLQSGREPVGSVRLRHGGVRSFEVRPEEVPALIDEIPALAALATFGGELTVRGASELRVKESDRIASLAAGLRALGAVVEEWSDGFHIDGRTRLRGGTADAAGDHRLAMAFAIAALGAARPSTVVGADSVDVSYPGFFETLVELTGGGPGRA